MSVHHHDTRYYTWLSANRTVCIFCNTNPVEQFHHMPLVGSARHTGPLPRRHSTYNVVWVCRGCHDECGTGIGEVAMVRKYFGTKARLYETVMRALHDYLDDLQG